MKKKIGLLLSAAFVSMAAEAEMAVAKASEETQPPATAPGRPGLIEEIVVTAQKRAENVQDIPLAITALSGDTLKDRQIRSTEDLGSLVPGLNFASFGAVARISVRGIGFDVVSPGAEGRIAYHLDGVYVSRPAAQFGTMFDVERLEVLRGPQGTLYGRNATGGSINVITREPTDEVSGYVSLAAGNYNRIGIEAALSGPVTDTLSARVAVISNDRDGYGKNLYTGHDIDNANSRGARAMLKWKPAHNLTALLSADYYSEDDKNNGLHYFGQYNPGTVTTGVALGGAVAPNSRDINSDRDPFNDRRFWSVTGRIELDLGSVVVRSISGYRHSSYVIGTELDYTQLRLNLTEFSEKARQYSQEFQFSGDLGKSRWIAGVYYFDEKIQPKTDVAINSITIGGPDKLTNGVVVAGRTHTRAAAVFGQFDLAVSDELKLILGARYGYEKISIVDAIQVDFATPYTPHAPIIPLPGFPRRDSDSNTAFTPKVGIEYKPSDDMLLYATVSKGFKSGGYNLGTNVPAFRPETIWAYEAGIKATMAGGRLRTNLAGFYYDYKNLQVSKIVNTSAIIENAAAAELYGLEAEFTARPTDRLQIDGTVSWLHTQYKDFASVDPGRAAQGTVILAGNRLTQAPEFMVNLGAQHEWELGSGSLKLRGEANYVSRIYFTAFNQLNNSAAANTKYNAFLTYESASKAWSLSLYGRNLMNKTVPGFVNVGSPFFNFVNQGTLTPPRTYGAEIRYNF